MHKSCSAGETRGVPAGGEPARELLGRTMDPENEVAGRARGITEQQARLLSCSANFPGRRGAGRG